MTENFIEKASEESSLSSEDSMSVESFLDYAHDNTNSVADSVSYLLRAIDHFGTRTVFEDGEEKERYVFFDDPYENGEHAILGNTDELNEFVDELRRRASEEGNNDKIIWFLGPTASGKSELKRCIINGIKGFAETEEGAKYTLEWTLDKSANESRMSYGSEESLSKEYYKSPVNINPLLLLPEETREEYIQEIEEEFELEGDIDPFSQEAMDILEDNHDFSEIVSEEFVRTKRFYPEVGDGIGVLHSEDGGSPKEKIVGSWMKGAMQKFAKRGQKNPQAFSYDGVLSQGNGLVSIVEDAGHHSDVLDKMLNVCEEEMVKLDNKISMNLDTVIMVFSNPDLEGQLDEYSEAGHHDPLRALRRRLDKYEFNYLTTLGIEGMLIKRMLSDDTLMWDDESGRMGKVSESMQLYETEIAPRCIEAASMYEVITRLKKDAYQICNTVEAAILLEEGEVKTEQGDIIKFDDTELESFAEGEGGIPVTYTVDKIVELVQNNDVVLPEDVINEMSDSLEEEPLFNHSEADHFSKMAIDVEDYIFQKQEEDILSAMVGDIEVTEEDVRDYIDSVLAWEDNDEDEYDAYELREFETRYLGQDSDDYNENAVANTPVVEFRRNIISPINKYMWEKRDEDFTVDEVPLSEAPSLRPLLEENDWDMVDRVYPDADLSLWESPPSETQTEELKEKTVNRMAEMHGYSEESAEEVTKKVIEAREAVKEVMHNGT